MKTLILYGSPIKLTRAHKLVRNKPKYYVRAVSSDCGVCEALTKARPMAGETVLNTVEGYDSP